MVEEVNNKKPRIRKTTRTNRVSRTRRTKKEPIETGSNSVSQSINIERIYTPQTKLPVPNQKKSKKKNSLSTVIILCILSFIISDYCTVVGDLYNTQQELKYARSQIQSNPQNQIAEALYTLGNIMTLPQGEQPTVMVISNASEAIAQQQFYSGAVDGDIVLVYPKAEKAIVWSPSRHKIVNVGGVKIEEPKKGSAKDRLDENDEESEDSGGDIDTI